MNPELNREGVIVNPNSLIEREPPQLGLGPCLGEPTLIDPLVLKILNPPHGGLPLLLHGLVIVRRDEHFSSALQRVEEAALGHEAEEPVTVGEMVRIEESAHVSGVEGEGLVEVGRRVAEAVVGRESCRGRWDRVGEVEEVVAQDLGAPCDLVFHRVGGWVGGGGTGKELLYRLLREEGKGFRPAGWVDACMWRWWLMQR